MESKLSLLVRLLLFFFYIFYFDGRLIGLVIITICQFKFKSDFFMRIRCFYYRSYCPVLNV